MIHHPTLQMGVGSGAFLTCRPNFRPHDVAAHVGSPLKSSNILVSSLRYSSGSQSCIVTPVVALSSASRCCFVENSGRLWKRLETPKPLSLLNSVSSVPSHSTGNYALQLESCFLSGFGNRKLFLGRSCPKSNRNPPLEVSRWRARFDGHSAGFGRRTLLSSKFESSHSQRVVLARSGAAAGTSALPPPSQPQNFWHTVWVNCVCFWVSVANRLQSIRIGWLDLLTMLRIVLLAAGAFGAYIASKRAWARFQAMTAEKAQGGGEGGGPEEGPMQLLARGATCVQSNMGPWSIGDMTLGLGAMAKITEKEPPAIPGQAVTKFSEDPNFLLRAQHWRAVSEAVYAKDPASFSLFTSLPESSLVGYSWEPTPDTFRPAYAVFVDAPYGAVVLAVRGTSHIIDMLLNSGASPEPFGDNGNYAHGGFVHAANMLHEEALAHIEKAFRDHSGSQKNLKLVIVGHSMGAAVGSLIALKLREKWPDLQCWAYCPPACMSLDLAKECKSFMTSFVANHDVVPRFSLHSIEKLRTRIQEFDWDEVERVAKDDEDWQNMKKALETFKGFQQKHKDTMEKLSSGSETAQGFINGTDNQKEQEEDTESTEDGDGCSPPPLHPPGRLFVVGSDPPGCGKMPESRSGVASERGYGSYPTFDESKSITWRMMEAEQEDLEEIIVSPWCISDHMLGNLCEAIGYLQSTCPPAIK